LSWNVDEYVQLHEATGEDHYLDIARILLHNTKVMLAVEGRLVDFSAPGWQQEHWSVAMDRGKGVCRWWVAWATVCHLDGMAKLQDRNPAVWSMLAGPPS
jgi:hypothetical protein